LAKVKKEEKSSAAAPIYTRQASGLVREVGLLRAAFFSLNPVGTAPGWALAFVGLFAFPLVFGVPEYTWVFLLMIPGFLLYAFLSSSLASAIPRTGGAYLYSSKILHPYMGWIESWSLVPFWMSTIAYEAYSIAIGFSFISIMLDFAYPNRGFAGGGTFFQSHTGLLVGGTIAIVITVILVLLNSRKFYMAMTVLGITSVLITVVLFLVPYLSSLSAFSSNFQSYSGQSMSAVITSASKNGFAIAAPTLATVVGLLSWQFWGPLGFNWNTYVSGEIKGNVLKNSFLGALIALMFFAFIWVVYPLSYVHFLGYNFTESWSYLYWNGFSAPLGIPPFLPFLAQLAHPNLTVLFLAISVGTIFSMIFTNAVYIWIQARTIFAWSFDRMAPEALARVDTRTNSPINSIIISCVGAWLFLVSAVFYINLASLIYFGLLLTIFMWIFPGLNGLLISRRRPDLFAKMSFNKKVLGIPLIAILGAVWLAYVIPVFGLALFYPIVKSLIASTQIGALSYLGTTGINLMIGVFIAGSFVYFIIRWYNKRRGIDTEMIFKSIPPE
jgi:basic amino acid/polyamine antiporter, APA family